MLDALAGIAGGLLGASTQPDGTGAAGGGTDGATGAGGNQTTSDARSTQKVANKSRAGGARLTLTSTSAGAGGPAGKSGAKSAALEDLTDSGIPTWLVVLAVVSLIALVVLALVLGR